MHYKIEVGHLAETVRKVLGGAIKAIVEEETKKANVIVGERVMKAAMDMSVEVSKMHRIEKDSPELNIIIKGKD